MADKITNDDRNSHKQIISNELDPVSGLQYDRYVLLNPELQKFNQETYDKMIELYNLKDCKSLEELRTFREPLLYTYNDLQSFKLCNECNNEII